MLEIYRKRYTNRFETEIAYYFFITTRGIKKYYEVSYEWIGCTNYIYSKYSVELNCNIRNIGKIENDIYRFTPVLFSEIKAQRRLSVLAKFVLYIISEVNNIPIYRLPKEVIYYHDGVEINLSVNAFVKTTYALIPKFEKVYRQI
ncbi:MAG: hypothetical protein L7G90_03120 [Candidatus Nanopusillus sp.]|nr:hypothetical protein [Candidatus Nanopusillus sp.]MCG2869046.1 hypothetical protein [Candidatus Nanopusillus sp.]